MLTRKKNPLEIVSVETRDFRNILSRNDTCAVSAFNRSRFDAREYINKRGKIRARIRRLVHVCFYARVYTELIRT